MVRLEHLQEELPILLARAGLSQYLYLFPHTHSLAGGSSSSLTSSLLATLEEEELAQLREHYREDMLMYGYT